jgi:hypothetical protein
MTSEYWTKAGKPREYDDGSMSEDDRIIDTYTRAFVMSMGVRCPTKFGLIPRFKEFCHSENDGLLPKTDEEIYALIPDFIEHLGEI